MKEDVTTQGQTANRKKKNTQKLLVVVAAILVTVGVLSGLFYAGYKTGEKHGRDQAKKEAAANPFSGLADANRFLPKYKSGEITSVSNNALVIKTSDGKEEKVTINDKTKVTRKTETLKLSDLKKGDKVTAFVGNDGTATRIVYRNS